MKNSFTAIDFETAQGKRFSIFQVGLVRVETGKIIKEISFLVQPPGNYYWDRFIDIHISLLKILPMFLLSINSGI